MSNRVQVDPEALRRQIERTPEFDDARRNLAEAIVERAKGFAPVLTGRFRDSLEVLEDGDVIAAGSKDHDANVIENGSVDTPAFAPLRRGARSLGVRVEDGPPPPSDPA